MRQGTVALLKSLGDTFTINGVRFQYLNADEKERKTNPERLLILKHAPFLAIYDDIMLNSPNNNVLEFGVAEGGSIIYFALVYPHLKFVGIDLRDENPAVLDYIKRLDLIDRVAIYYNTSQDDEEAIKKIVRDEFKGHEIGVVMDDASHFYSKSRRTFEIILPYIAGGGYYCLEDWGWSHEDEYQVEKFADQPALSNLVFELAALHKSSNGLIFDRFDIHPAVTILRRGHLSLGAGFKLDDSLKLRGRRFPFL
jgi:cephalosporin hydroxylase